jgi:hypothetical protein
MPQWCGTLLQPVEWNHAGITLPQKRTSPKYDQKISHPCRSSRQQPLEWWTYCLSKQDLWHPTKKQLPIKLFPSGQQTHWPSHHTPCYTRLPHRSNCPAPTLEWQLDLITRQETTTIACETYTVSTLRLVNIRIVIYNTGEAQQPTRMKHRVNT